MDIKNDSFHWVYWATAVFAVVLICLLIFFAVRNQPGTVPSGQVSQNLFAPGVQKLGERAFGDLSSPSANPAPTEQTASTNATAPATSPAVSGTGGSAQAIASPVQGMPIRYEPIQLVYKYTGPALQLDKTQGLVYLRQKGSANAEQMARLFSSASISVVDLSTFDHLGLNEFSMSENKKNGLQISVNLDESMVSMNPVWNNWPQQAEPIPSSEAPSDSAILSITDSFLSAHKIDRSSYGDGQVNTDYRTFMPLEDSNFPKQVIDIQVTYPLLFDGVQTVESYGGVYGLSLSVRVPQNVVSNVSNLIAPSFEASTYPLVTDASRVLTIAEQGGQPIYYLERQDTAKQVEVDLDRADPVVLHYWQYKDNASQELYVPALRFHVAKVPDAAPYVSPYIVVPLVDEILKTYEQPVNPPTPVPLPVPLSGQGVATPGAVGGVVAPDATPAPQT